MKTVGSFFVLSVSLSLSDSVYGAAGCTSTTIDALVSVDYELRITLNDSLYGATACASATADASVRNLVCHLNTPPCVCIYFIIS